MISRLPLLPSLSLRPSRPLSLSLPLSPKPSRSLGRGPERTPKGPEATAAALHVTSCRGGVTAGGPASSECGRLHLPPLPWPPPPPTAPSGQPLAFPYLCRSLPVAPPRAPSRPPLAHRGRRAPRASPPASLSWESRAVSCPKRSLGVPLVRAVCRRPRCQLPARAREAPEGSRCLRRSVNGVPGGGGRRQVRREGDAHLAARTPCSCEGPRAAASVRSRTLPAVAVRSERGSEGLRRRLETLVGARSFTRQAVPRGRECG